MALTRDYFGRVVATHRCPECGASFLGPADCRPCPANGFAHPEPVKALPIVGCCEPPYQRFAVALPVLVSARSESEAYDRVDQTLRDYLPKRVVERYGERFHPIAVESRSAAGLRMCMENLRRMSADKAAARGD